MKTLLYIALGGSLGSVLRYLISNWIKPNVFPYATFIVNVVGCLLIGLLFGYFEKNTQLSKDLKFLLITGFCGGFTTFSAFSIENVQLLQNNQFVTAFIYISLSVILGIGMTFFGMYLSKNFV